jgi:hypothetical protein
MASAVRRLMRCAPNELKAFMPVVCEITHRTVYRYTEPVRFGEHRVLFRPYDSHDLRVLATDLRTRPAAIRLIQDPNSNSVALVQPLFSANELQIDCTLTIEQAHTNNLELPVAGSARCYPFTNSVDERLDLEHIPRPHDDDRRANQALGSRCRCARQHCRQWRTAGSGRQEPLTGPRRLTAERRTAAVQTRTSAVGPSGRSTQG